MSPFFALVGFGEPRRLIYTYIYIWYPPPPPPVTYPFSPCLKSPSCTASKLGVQYSVFLGRRLKYNKNRIHETVEKPKIPKPKKKTKKQNQKKTKTTKTKKKTKKPKPKKNQKSPRVPENCFFFFFGFLVLVFCFFLVLVFLVFWFWYFGFLVRLHGTRQQLHIFQCAYANCAFQK